MPIRDDAPNILWIMTDEQRADSLSADGRFPWVRSPNLDRITNRGVHFGQAFCQSPICVPSRASLLSGRYPHNLGVCGFQASWWDYEMFPEVLARHGYQTSNFGKEHHHRHHDGPKGPLHSPFSITGDWSHWGPGENPFDLDPEYRGMEDQFGIIRRGTWHKAIGKNPIIGGTHPLPSEQAPATVTANNALRFLAQGIEEPFLCRVSFIFPHTPTLPPRPYDQWYRPEEMPVPEWTPEELAAKPRWEREVVVPQLGTHNLTRDQLARVWTSYYGLCGYVDAQIGRLLDFVERRRWQRPLLIMFCSDHGSNLGENCIHEKHQFYDQSTRVPLVFSLPGYLPEGKRVDALAELLDIAPTLFDLIGVPIPDYCQGRNLVPLMRRECDQVRDAAFGEQYLWETLRKWIRTERYAMHVTPNWDDAGQPTAVDPDGALYDLSIDPGERLNRFNDPAYRAVREQLWGRLVQWDSEARQGSVAPEHLGPEANVWGN